MKRFITLALLALFTLGLAPMASAVDFNMSGASQTGFIWTDNLNFFDMDGDATSEDDFDAYQRVRFYWEAVANENLRMVLGLQADFRYGSSVGDDSDYGTDDNDGLTKENTFIEFTWPNTALRFRTGFWDLVLPGNFGDPIANNDAAQVTASYAFNDMVALTLVWARLSDTQLGGEGDLFPGATASNNEQSDEVDLFGAILPVTGDGFTFTPWFAYTWHGQNASAGGPLSTALAGLNSTAASLGGVTMDDDVNVWWTGAQFSLDMFDPFVFYADLFYGSQDGAQNQLDREGWFIDLAVDYRMDMVTPRLFFAWGSGEDEDVQDGSERMPTLGGARAEGCGCGVTSFGTDGSAAGWAPRADSILTGNGFGFWTIGLSLMNFSFVENLSHTFTVAYGQGTNDSELVKDAINGRAAWMVGAGGLLDNYQGFVTDEDSFWEINFDHTYQMYENLAAILELGYINVDLDEDTWGSVPYPPQGVAGVTPVVNIDIAEEVQSAWKAAFVLHYSF